MILFYFYITSVVATSTLSNPNETQVSDNYIIFNKATSFEPVGDNQFISYSTNGDSLSTKIDYSNSNTSNLR